MRYAVMGTMLALLCSTSCAPGSSGDVIGKYRAESLSKTSELELKGDGSFSQKAGGEVLDGSWFLERGIVFMKPCLSAAKDDFGRRLDTCSMSAARTPFGMELSVDPDYGIAYRK